jgi:S1-C subfamily serine protease
MMSVSLQEKEKSIFLKLFPIAKNNSENNNQKSSGTGFGITSSGIIVTNSHVVNGSNNILVRGIHGDFSKKYSAKLIIDDTKNDIAIIRINDSTFTNIDSIPYTISSKSSDVGSTVFALGYPLKAVMGEEIKLTNGIISSKSGYKGDVTSYQISVPLQPGNSGGPLFDENGNLIGIVNAVLSIGENVSYAIKASYLTNLLDQLEISPNLQNKNILNGKKLSDQVKLINKYVYIIEAN